MHPAAASAEFHPVYSSDISDAAVSDLTEGRAGQSLFTLHTLSTLSGKGALGAESSSPAMESLPTLGFSDMRSARFGIR